MKKRKVREETIPQVGGRKDAAKTKGGNGAVDLDAERDLKMARLVYLVAHHQIRIPDPIAKYLPAGEWLARLHKGPSSAGFSSQALLKKYRSLYQVGSQMGIGTRTEGTMLITRFLDDEVSQRKDLSSEDRIKIYTMLDRFAGSAESMLSAGQVGVVHLNKAPILAGIPKWQTGFTPLDTVMGGVYQGIIMLMGKPGTGKTSVFISLLETMVRSKTIKSSLFVQNEIPQSMMLGRMAPVLRRTKFRPGDILITESWGAEDILKWVDQHPDPERVILFDSPDVVVGGGDEKRLYLESAYQTLVRIKQKCRTLFVTSQPRRKDARGVLTIESVAEAWAKAWFADAIIGMARTSRGLRLTGLKNRFGVAGQSGTMAYDYETLLWEAGEVETTDDW